MEKKSHVISCWATSPRGFSLQISNGNCSLRFWRGDPQPSRIFKSGTISSANGRWESNWNPIKSRDSLCLQFADALPQEQMLCQTQVIFAKKKRGLPALPGLQYVTLKALRAHLQHDYQRIQMTGTDFPTHPECRRSARSREKKHSVILCAFGACGQTHGISQSSVCHILIS